MKAFASAFRALGRVGIGPILALAFLVRLVPLLIHYNFLVLPQGGADAEGFERRAWALSSGSRGAITEYLGSGVHFLAYFGSLVYDLVGRQPMALGLGMALLGVALVYVVYRIVFEITDDVAAGRVAGLMVALFPQLVLHSVLFLREMPVAFFLALGVWGAVRFLNRHSIPGLLVFCVATVLATIFHTGAIIAIPGLLLGMLFARPKGERGGLTRHLVNAAGAVTLIGVILFMDETGFGLGQFGGGFDTAMDVFETGEMRATLGGAAYPEWMRIRGGLASEGWKIPIRYLAFLFSPVLPFLVRGAYHLLGALDAALYIGMFAVMVRNWRVMARNRVVLSLLVMGLSLAFVYALGVSNFGTAIRHRAKIVPVFILIAVSAYALASAKIRQRASPRFEKGFALHRSKHRSPIHGVAHPAGWTGPEDGIR